MHSATCSIVAPKKNHELKWSPPTSIASPTVRPKKQAKLVQVKLRYVYSGEKKRKQPVLIVFFGTESTICKRVKSRVPPSFVLTWFAPTHPKCVGAEAALVVF